ncbi:ANTAR domain-containing protein [Actinokineospora enzanensis]|uniref:ANTAR domain-containing protein n=1 Tax=Actinokineospora enzanensis TaxID=155975 RepID=UPI00035F212B|nr:ANTAR domain-containing protein [Actinokineospora enzanensis]
MRTKDSWLEGLMRVVLHGISGDLPGALGVSVSAPRPRSPHPRPVVFAGRGVGRALEETQQRANTGPSAEAALGGAPVSTADLWGDRRWPGLSLDRAAAGAPNRADALRAVRGAAALPGLRDNGSRLVLAVYLPEPPTAAAQAVLRRHERLVAAGVAALVATAGPRTGTDRALDLLHGRDVVEQAKGVLVARHGTDSATAWEMLRELGVATDAPVESAADRLVREAEQERE